MANIPSHSKPSQDWEFTQTKGDKKKIRLSGWSAPFGRPRKTPVVTTTIEVRQKTVYYPGNPVPTRHIFGLKWGDWELSGRWMDTYGGPGFAKGMVATVNDFFADQRDVQIRWGNIISFVGFMDRFEPSYESEGTVAWKIHMLINQDDSVISKAKQNLNPVAQTPNDYMTKILTSLLAKPTMQYPTSMPGNLLDALDNAVSSINSTISSVVGFASQVESFETAAFNDVKRLRAGLGQLKTELVSFKNTQADIANSAQLLSNSADETIQLQDLTASNDITMIQSAGQIETMDKAALAANGNSSAKSYIAQQGDTWELISIFKFGDANEANAIRQANGISFGSNPVPGVTYKIPNVIPSD